MRKSRVSVSIGMTAAVFVAVVGFNGITGYGQSTSGGGAGAAAGQTGTGREEPELTSRSMQAGAVVVPQSSRDQGGNFAHTNYVVLSANANAGANVTTPGPMLSADEVGPEGAASPTVTMAETPKSMGCVYVSSPNYAGCVPNFSDVGGPSSAGYGAIVIVDAFDNPWAASDLARFDQQFGLAAPPSFTKIYANGNGACTVPAYNSGWALEASLDIEWAHVFAPKAAIVLVEACSNSYTDLFYAEQVAFNYIVNNFTSTGGQVTNSWQGGEFSGQISYDPLFSDHYYNAGKGWKPPILGLASSGDSGYISGQAGYPSANPWVLTAGGTTVIRNATNFYYTTEQCWGGSGGGISQYETWSNSWTGGNMGPWAPFQYQIFGMSSRRTPDLSFNGDPASGVYVYAYLGGSGGWFIVGGTSVSSPALASIINRAGNKLGTVFLNAITGNNGFFNTEEQELIYSQLPTKKAYGVNFRDVTAGSNGTTAVAGWDYCTGVGRPKGLVGK
jgi:kumamolisin